jgi:transcriptional regulator with XRE-family HTH domain
MVGKPTHDIGRALDGGTGAPSTSVYVRSLRIGAGLSVAELAERVGVSVEWLERFEAGLDEDGISYERLLVLVRATQPPRPEWWDDGHEHDLHLPHGAITDRDGNRSYWAKIEQVREANRGPHR